MSKKPPTTRETTKDHPTLITQLVRPSRRRKLFLSTMKAEAAANLRISRVLAVGNDNDDETECRSIPEVCNPSPETVGPVPGSFVGIHFEYPDDPAPRVAPKDGQTKFLWYAEGATKPFGS
ncbi:hypothetical protein QLX08_006012 [Tetragonisca angustula]|uniref:Uncharacterized protein n=2 Tax=Tetragonisca angustula TaxID=166442 RepID=A0AAW0ZVX2_9HYME